MKKIKKIFDPTKKIKKKKTKIKSNRKDRQRL